MHYQNVLITGGLGFVGSTIAHRFLASGASVTIVDSMISNVADPEEFPAPHARVVQQPVDQYLARNEVFDFDFVIHAASYVGASGVLKYEGRLASDMISTASILADRCAVSDVPLLFISSSEVYGVSGVLSEDMDVRVPAQTNARIEYALGKLTAEVLLTHRHQSGVRALSIRPFNIVGERQSRAGGFVLPTFVQQALADLPVTVFGDGSQHRSFVSVEDLATFVVDVLGPEDIGRNHVINIGNPENTCSVRVLAQRVVARIGSKSNIISVDPVAIYGEGYHEAESHQKICDVSAAQSLGWAPRDTLDTIIDRTAVYYRQNRDLRGSDARERRNQFSHGDRSARR